MFHKYTVSRPAMRKRRRRQPGSRNGAYRRQLLRINRPWGVVAPGYAEYSRSSQNCKRLLRIELTEQISRKQRKLNFLNAAAGAVPRPVGWQELRVPFAAQRQRY